MPAMLLFSSGLGPSMTLLLNVHSNIQARIMPRPQPASHLIGLDEYLKS